MNENNRDWERSIGKKPPRDDQVNISMASSGEEVGKETINCVDGKQISSNLLEKNEISESGDDDHLSEGSDENKKDNASCGEPENKKDDASCDEENKENGALVVFSRLQPPPLFNEEDEIILLTEYIDFMKKHEKNDWVNFHASIKDKLSQENFTRKQVLEKVRRMKDKFLKSSNKKLDGHEARVFQLSKSMWGNSEKGRKRKRTRKREYVPQGECVDPLHYPLLSSFFTSATVPPLVKQFWTLMGSEAAQKYENQWSKLYQKQLSLCIEENDFNYEVCLLIKDLIKRVPE